MEKFTKYYSYNQVIENFDVLIMTEQEYLANKDKLDNPQRVVIVNRAGGPREPKMPQWFKQWNENVYEKKQPKWFAVWCEQEFKPLIKRIDNLIQKNNLKE